MRYEAWQIALNPQTGWMKRNEVRQRENLPTDPDFAGMAQIAPPAPALDSRTPAIPARQGEPATNGR